MPNAYVSRVIADGASHYYRLADPVPATTYGPVMDAVGTAHGTASNLIGVTGGQPGFFPDDAAMAFTVSANIPIPIITPLQFSIEAWIYRTGPGGGVSRIYRGGNSEVDIGPISSDFTLWIALAFTDATATGWLNTGYVIPLTTWLHVVVTWNGTTILAYVNGAQIYSNGTFAGKTLNVGTPTHCTIGSDQGCFEGRIDEWAIYPHALIAADILAHYTLATTPEAPALPASSTIDRALLALVSGDTTLMALTPDGVFWDEAPPHATRFVIVSLLHEADEPMFGSRAYEAAHYLVKAVMLSTAGGDIAAAADRIDLLLEGAQLLAEGYTPMLTARDERIRFTEVDALDDTVRWLHRGGQYLVWMSL